ncbi:hypothetical protein EPN96_10875 [bacterium]|nr:MAG: hypothetical protein EPN96_10875 [bacterium]
MSPIAEFITWLRKKPHLLMAIFISILGGALLFDAFAERHAPHFGGDRIIGFWAFFGLAGCLLMTKFMKWLGHDLLQKPLDFYSRNDSGEE